MAVRLFAALLVGAVAAFSTSVRAATIEIPNFSFEDDVMSLPPGHAAMAPTGWVFSDAFTSHLESGIHHGSIVNTTMSHGEQEGYIYTYGSVTTAHLTSSAPVGTVQANTVYTLIVGLGNRGNGIYRPNQYGISILVDDTVVATTTLADAHSVLTPQVFTDYSVTFSSIDSPQYVGGDIKVRLTHTGIPINSVQGTFDNVRLSYEAIPEPSSCLLMGLGLLGAAVIHRGRRGR